MQTRRSRQIARGTRFWPSAMPISFHGNPVSTMARSHSLAQRPTASAKMRAGARRPQQSGDSKAERREKSEAGRQRQNAERQRPGEFVGLDEKGRAEPPEAGDKITKPPPPAHGRKPIASIGPVERPLAHDDRPIRRSARPPPSSAPASPAGSRTAAGPERRSPRRRKRSRAAASPTRE